MRKDDGLVRRHGLASLGLGLIVVGVSAAFVLIGVRIEQVMYLDHLRLGDDAIEAVRHYGRFSLTAAAVCGLAVVGGTVCVILAALRAKRTG
ncbi:hypothetical protein BKD30_06765 [Tersicoccus phoenicis]|uniref:Uncharacterized protein n=1 Tax=Tersicoccus phoenicis TaxID=554083 RepID=A0A1R1LBT5_9MICC|nr:hypothetical protein [Tersicoccus phoenicis]OMH24989.1 hypothetical protein BKD30_06765 [Tersicoccus phoenicis]